MVSCFVFFVHFGLTLCYLGPRREFHRMLETSRLAVKCSRDMILAGAFRPSDACQETRDCQCISLGESCLELQKQKLGTLLVKTGAISMLLIHTPMALGIASMINRRRTNVVSRTKRDWFGKTG